MHYTPVQIFNVEKYWLNTETLMSNLWVKFLQTAYKREHLNFLAIQYTL